MTAARSRFAAVASSLALGIAIVSSAELASADVVVRGERSALDPTTLASLVRLELGEKAAAVDVVVEVAKGRAAVTLARPDGEPRTGVVELPAASAGSGEAERTVALFVGELSREDAALAGPEPEVHPPRSATTAPPTSELSPSVRAASSGTAASAVGGASARVIASGGALFLGPFVTAGLGIGDRLRAGVVGRYLVASTDVALGTVDARMASGGVNAAYRALALGAVAVDTGPGVDVAWINGSGEGIGAASASGIGVAGAWLLEARWSFARRWLFVAAVEAGWLAPGLDLRAHERTVLAASGGFGGVSVGLGFER